MTKIGNILKIASMSIAYVIHILFITYTILLFARIVSSWFPAWQEHNLIRFVSFYTDPYLNLFRKLLPPLGGVLDISPILAFLVLRLAETILLSLFS
jgi:YggT family protein